ncbi:hypothetical protein [Streptomyces sp. NPDC088254]|uniref:hypothetical protein n=1 Tax=Streptomyces sp. NPDC088254 TaxID=3365847 RepID=UPI0038050EF8
MCEVRPLADAVERDGRETSTRGPAALRIARARRSYRNAGAEASAVLLRRAVPPAELHPARCASPPRQDSWPGR